MGRARWAGNGCVCTSGGRARAACAESAHAPARRSCRAGLARRASTRSPAHAPGGAEGVSDAVAALRWLAARAPRAGAPAAAWAPRRRSSGAPPPCGRCARRAARAHATQSTPPRFRACVGGRRAQQGCGPESALREPRHAKLVRPAPHLGAWRSSVSAGSGIVRRASSGKLIRSGNRAAAGSYASSTRRRRTPGCRPRPPPHPPRRSGTRLGRRASAVHQSGARLHRRRPRRRCEAALPAAR